MRASTTTELPQHATALQGEDSALIAEIKRLADEAAQRDAFSGVVLIGKDGESLFEQAYGYANKASSSQNIKDTLFDIASLGKMFASVAIAQLMEEGKISYDVPVGRYMSGLPDGFGKKVTAHHLLTHTSGLPDLSEELFDNPPGSLNGYLPHFKKLALVTEPGTKRSYNNAGFVLLGMLVEHLSGLPYESYLRKRVFAPAQMGVVRFTRDRGPSVNSAIPYMRKEGATAWLPATDLNAASAGPHGGALATAGGLNRFLYALRSGVLVRPETAILITTPQKGALSPYGFGELPFKNDRLVGHSGGNTGVSADAYLYWNSGYTIIVLSNYQPPASHKIAGAARKLLEARTLGPKTPP